MPGRLNGTGARAAEVAAEIKALIDDAQDTIDARHEREAAELEERIERYGQRGSGKKDIVDRHKREVRRHRFAELRLALAVFAGVYRDALATARHPDELVEAIHRLDRVALKLEVFPNETLMLQALLAQLPALDPESDCHTPSVGSGRWGSRMRRVSSARPWCSRTCSGRARRCDPVRARPAVRPDPHQEGGRRSRARPMQVHEVRWSGDRCQVPVVLRLGSSHLRSARGRLDRGVRRDHRLLLLRPLEHLGGLRRPRLRLVPAANGQRKGTRRADQYLYPELHGREPPSGHWTR